MKNTHTRAAKIPIFLLNSFKQFDKSPYDFKQQFIHWMSSTSVHFSRAYTKKKCHGAILHWIPPSLICALLNVLHCCCWWKLQVEFQFWHYISSIHSMCARTAAHKNAMNAAHKKRWETARQIKQSASNRDVDARRKPSMRSELGWKLLNDLYEIRFFVLSSFLYLIAYAT